jgi:hypothetical protein
MAKEKKDKQRSIKHAHKRADKIYVLLFIHLLHIFISFNPLFPHPLTKIAGDALLCP